MGIKTFISNIFSNKNKDPTTTTALFDSNGGSRTLYSVNEYLNKNDTVQSIVYTIANNCSKFELKHKRIKEYSPRIDIKRTLRRPNEMMGISDFIQRMVINRELYNNAFAVIKRTELGQIIGIYPINFQSAEMLTNKSGDIFIRFKFVNGDSEIINYKDLIHLRKHYYDNDFFGQQYSDKLASLLDIHENLDNAISESLKGFSIKRWLLKSTAVIPEPDVKNMADKIETLYINNRETSVVAVDPRVNLEQIQQNEYKPNESVYNNAEKRIYSFFNINEKIIKSDYTEEEYNAFYENAIEPIMKQLVEEMTYKLFTLTELDYGNEIIINPNMLQFASLNKRNEIVKTITQIPNLITINEVREIFYMDNIEGGEEFANRSDRTISTDEVEVENGT